YRDYRKVSKYVDDKVDLFSGIERYLLGVIEKNNSYNKENYTAKKQKEADLFMLRNNLLNTKVKLSEDSCMLNKEDKKEAAIIHENKKTINKIDEEIAIIDKEIVKLKDETERLEKEYEQENTLNDVVQNISRWLKENENMVKAIMKIDTNNMANK
ncbi:TPA: type III effector protein, partial [Escherichia coli]|nr:type III effector protein [Escherichia coli]